MRHRDALHLKARKRPKDAIIQLTYKRYRNFCCDLLHKLKHQFEQKQLDENKNNPKKLWQIVKDICHTSKQNAPATELLKSKNNTTESLDYCNDYFSTVGGKLANEILNNQGITEQLLADEISIANGKTHSFYMHPTDEFEVDSIIRNLKTSGASGLDCINNNLIKQIKNHIITPLTHICNLSISYGEFPEPWKKAAVCPVYKSGPKDTPSNYRPISLLSCLSKVLEKLINQRLISYLETNNLLSNRQYGFRRGKSTEDTVDDLVSLICNLLDSGNACIGVFLDLAKAFDTVSIPILLRKLEYIGIRGLPLQWFQSYLSNRKQVVRIGESMSTESRIQFGIPQGSILGPTMFLVYINDISDFVPADAQHFCYADDTAVIFSDATWDGAFQKAEAGLTSLGKYLNRNLLTLNTDKTKYVTFYKTLASCPPDTNGIKVHRCNLQNNCLCPEIQSTNTIKYLGIKIDNTLSFKAHIHTLSGKVRKLINIMKLLRHCANKDLLKYIYLALCQSIIGYCLRIWGGSAKTHMMEIERAQRSVLKVMLGKPFRYSTNKLFDEWQLLSVRRLYIHLVTIRVHKTLRTSPDYPEIIKKRVYKIPTSSVSTSFARRHSYFLYPHIYNNVAKECSLKQLSVHEVKLKVKRWLLSLNYDQTESIITIQT